MKKYYLFFLIFVIVLSITHTSCRPPELEGAVVHYKAGRLDQAYDLAQEATQKYPDNSEAWYYLGELQGKKGMIKEMLGSFDKSLSLDNTFEKEIIATRAKTFNTFYNDGVASYNAFIKIEDKESEQAKKMLEKEIENFQNAILVKDDYMANRLISVAYQFLGDDENTLKYLESAAKVAPDSVQSWIELGFYYNRKQDYVKAAENFKKGIEVDPNNAESWTLYAQALDFSGVKQEAVDAYLKAMEINPTEKAIPFNLGLIYNKKANDSENEVEKKSFYQESIKYFYKVYELDPELKDVYDLLTTLLLTTERYDEAEKILKEGIERFPDSSSMWQNISFLYAKQGRKDEAEEAYKHSQELK
jgi:tetratricopeptide (TPR) repeat protein